MEVWDPGFTFSQIRVGFDDKGVDDVNHTLISLHRVKNFKGDSMECLSGQFSASENGILHFSQPLSDVLPLTSYTGSQFYKLPIYGVE